MRHSGDAWALGSASGPTKLCYFSNRQPSHQAIAPMISSELLKMLVCPENQSSLDVAGKELIARLNRAIALGQLRNKAGQKLEKPLGGGLLRKDQNVLYPIMDDIPMMLVDEGIWLDQPALEA